MGKASRTKRRRAAVRSAKRARNNNWWYGLTALIVIAGIALIVYAKATNSTVGPVINTAGQGSPPTPNSHWHAALGVYDCDHWMSDGSGNGVWNWPASVNVNGATAPGRVGTNTYAGLHSHDDGVIHMEPSTSDETGRHATVGKYFEFGGWRLSSTSFDFLGTQRKNGDKCAKGGAGTVQWMTGNAANNPRKWKVRTGSNPAGYKLYQGDIVVIAFLPPGKSIESLGDPPSVANLDKALGAESVAPVTGTTTPAIAPPTTAKPLAPTTSKP